VFALGSKLRIAGDGRGDGFNRPSAATCCPA
jgi:hypothetical protein